MTPAIRRRLFAVLIFRLAQVPAAEELRRTPVSPLHPIVRTAQVERRSPRRAPEARTARIPPIPSVVQLPIPTATSRISVKAIVEEASSCASQPPTVRRVTTARRSSAVDRPPALEASGPPQGKLHLSAHRCSRIRHRSADPSCYGRCTGLAPVHRGRVVRKRPRRSPRPRRPLVAK